MAHIAPSSPRRADEPGPFDSESRPRRSAAERPVTTSVPSHPAEPGGASLAWIPQRIDDAEGLDRVVDPIHEVAQLALPGEPLRGALKGAPLGHPLHPVLTDLPIGFWTSSFVLDLIPTAWARRSADAMVGLGVLSALPTMWTGVADWVDLDRRTRRSGAVHAAANLTATVLYATSYRRRRQGRRLTGVALAMAGAAAATAGGFLGGHLAFGDGAGAGSGPGG